MKRALLCLLTAGIFCISSSHAEAFLFGKKKEAAAKAPAQPQAAQPETPAVEKAEIPKAEPAKIDTAQEDKAKLDQEARRKLVEKKRGELNNTEWLVEISAIGGQERPESGTITFKNNRVAISNYGKHEFPETNYTITVQNDGGFVWETMQVSEKSGTAFWRGEMDPGMKSMRGSLSLHSDEYTIHDYSFTSTEKKRVPQPAAQQ
jgi:hypothetical protein